MRIASLGREQDKAKPRRAITQVSGRHIVEQVSRAFDTVGGKERGVEVHREG
jgi:hypothetical protein